MCVPAHPGMSLLAVLWAFQVPCYTAAGMCLFLFPATKQGTYIRKGKRFFRTPLAKSKEKSILTEIADPEKRICVKKRLFQYGSTETWKLLHKSLYRSKACQCAYLHATHLGMSLLLWLFGLPSASLNRRQDMPFFLFCP